MESMDRNDVDLSVLFNWGNEFTIADTSGDDIMTVYIRLIGDADLNRARVYALRESSKLRKKLKSDTDEREAYIADISTIEKDSLVELLLALMLRDITTKVVKEVNTEIRIPKEPKGEPSLEEQEKYQEEIDNWPKVRSDLVTEKMDKYVEIERKKLSRTKLDKLYKEYEVLLINRTCENRMNEAFTDAVTFYGTYKDEKYKERLFSDIEEFINLPGFIKDQFNAAYQTLDIDMPNLKKLPEVMQ